MTQVSQIHCGRINEKKTFHFPGRILATQIKWKIANVPVLILKKLLLPKVEIGNEAVYKMGPIDTTDFY